MGHPCSPGGPPAAASRAGSLLSRWCAPEAQVPLQVWFSVFRMFFPRPLPHPYAHPEHTLLIFRSVPAVAPPPPHPLRAAPRGLP